MPTPPDPDELKLVRLAITLGKTTRGCCEWDEKAARIFRHRPPLDGLLPERVREMLIDQVEQGREVVQVAETRTEWNCYRFYYKAILDVHGLPPGLFVELRLIDEDPDVPTVHIVSSH